MKRILMISHTDVTDDSRILKSLQVASDSGWVVLAMGVVANTNRNGHMPPNTRNIVISWFKPIRKVKDLWLRLKKWNGKSVLVDENSASALSVKRSEEEDSNKGKLIRRLATTLTLLEMNLKFLANGIRFKPSLVHCHDVYALPAAVLLKLFTQSRLIYDAHELEAHVTGATPGFTRVVKTLERWAWPKVDHLITVSPSTQKWYLGTYGQKPSSLVLNSPIATKLRSEPTDLYFQRKFGLSKEVKVYLYIGHLTIGRGIDLILAAIQSAKPQSSAVVFLGSGEFESVIRGQKDFGKTIFHHLPVPHEEVVSVASSASYGLCLIENVSLSDYYCLPNKLFEYAFAGIRVIASDFPDMRQLIDSYDLGIYCDPTVEALANVIRTNDAIDSSPTPRKLADIQALSWGSQSSELKKVFESLEPLSSRTSSQ
jgi:glycosyltransferase involved in cell wall biosynthesis